MNPKVTVVTMTYNKFDRIYETLGSVLKQDYPNIELIISDDGSDCFPKEIIESWLEKESKENVKWIILTSEQNQGTVKNINKAYKIASGKYIINLSADDVFYDSDVIRRIVKDMEFKGCEILATRRMVCSESGQFLGYMPKDKNIKKIEKLNSPYLQHRAFITGEFFDMASGSAICIQNDIIKALGYYNESYVLWEDGPLFTLYTKDKLISTDYNIISIKYALGGVSNSGMNPLMSADYQHFNATDRCDGIDDYDAITRMRVRYFKERDEANTIPKLLLLYLKNPVVILVKIWYRLTAH